jgi:hypothetical protein
MIIKYYKDYIDDINEGLIKTYPGYKVLNELNIFSKIFNKFITESKDFCVFFD